MDERLEWVKTSLPTRTRRAVELATEKGASNWLTEIPIKELNFRDAQIQELEESGKEGGRESNEGGG